MTRASCQSVDGVHGSVSMIDESIQHPPDTNAPEANTAAAEPVVAAPGIPLMITQRQRVALRDLGFSDGDIRLMTPGEAHRRLV